MTYLLAIGDRSYSSWSLRGWLLFDVFGIPVKTQNIDFYAASVAEQLSDFAPARTVPVLKTAEGTIIPDSLAIAEELASRHPDAGLWPTGPSARATARALAAEMHSGFSALRTDCPMNLRTGYRDVPVSEDVKADLARLEEIWSDARTRHGTSTPWLTGDYSVADAFYAPVAARIAGYGLPVGPDAQDYVEAHLAHPSFRRWRAMGLAKGATLPWYDRDYPKVDWPGPTNSAAKAVDAGPAENTHCPYSGDPVTHFLEFEGPVFGFCNAFCRDKTVADPEAWTDFVALART